MTNEVSIDQIKEMVRRYYDYESEQFSVHEGDADYYILIKIKDHYVGATLIEEFEEIGLHIHSFQTLNGCYGKYMQFCLSGDLK